MPESTQTVQYLDFPTREWQGGNTLVQGVKWAGRDFFAIQADKTVAGENTIIRRYDANRNYKGYLTVPGGGHGSATGVIQINDTTSRHILPADERGIRIVDYIIGNAGKPPMSFRDTVGWCSGVSCNNDKKRLSVRKGGSKQTVSWYDRDAILKGVYKTEPLFRFAFPTPDRSPGAPTRHAITYQGHYNFGDSDFFAFETDYNGNRAATGYRSWCEQWTNGKRVAILDTTRWGKIPGKSFNAEPQGFMGFNGKLYFVKRIGGANANRIIRAIPCNF